jgi:hypothetical protein
MLILAAKAAGYTINRSLMAEREAAMPNAVALALAGVCTWWDPLTDSGQALELAVKLHLYLRPMSFLGQDGGSVIAGVADWTGVEEQVNNDPCAATRRAITRAAAEIGRTMT